MWVEDVSGSGNLDCNRTESQKKEEGRRGDGGIDVLIESELKTRDDSMVEVRRTRGE